MAATNDTLLTEKELSSISDMRVLDQQGESVPFGSLYASQRTVIVFIRHFWCGACQMYVSELAQVPKAALERAGVRLVIVGCGQPVRIPAYKEETGFEFDIYCDPTDQKSSRSPLYDAVGAVCTFARAEKPPSYIKKGYWTDLFQSMWRGPLKHLTEIGTQGRWDQNGGEFILGPGNNCTFAWRMRNSNDHIPVADLMKHAGVDFVPEPRSSSAAAGVPRF